MQKVTTCLWFDKNAEEAMNSYISVFNNSPFKIQESKIVSLSRFPAMPQDGPGADLEGLVANGIFELAGQQIIAFDGGPQFKLNEASSLIIDCDSQEEVDYYWNALSAVPEAEACGWLKDTYGLSWQVVPKALGELLNDPDKEKAARVVAVMMGMKKLDVAELQRAYDGK